MADQNENLENRMNWSTGPLNWNGFNLRNFMYHSTPIQYRPLPTASPNMSKINPPGYVSFHVSLDFSNSSDFHQLRFDAMMSQLAERLARIKLE